LIVPFLSLSGFHKALLNLIQLENWSFWQE